jgi:GAF domain-containing protein
VLNSLLIAATITAGLIYLLWLPAAVQAEEWAALTTYGLVTFGLLALTLSRRLAYSLRAGGFLFLLLAAGGYMLGTQGLPGSGRFLLLLFPWLAAMLLAEGRFSSLLRYAALVLSILTVAVIGLLAVQGYLLIGAQDVGLRAWLAAGLGFSLAALAGGTAIDWYLRRLEGGLDESEDTIQGFDQERLRLENQVQQGTYALERRLVQIRTAAEITQSISNLLVLEELLPRVCELMKERFGLYYVGVFLIEAEGEAVLAAGTGEAGRQMLAEGHRLRVGGDSMIGWATARRQARIALDVGKDQVRFSNPHLPETRSELALPIASQQTVLGALTIQSENEAAFDQDDVVVMQGIADSLANAIENARMFAQIQANLDEITTLHRQYLRRAWLQVLETGGPQEYEFVPPSAPAESAAEKSEGSVVELPIHLREQVIGALRLEAGPERPLGGEELAFIESVINQAALALENARLLDETRERASQEMVAANIATRIWSSTDVETILRTALQELGGSLDAAQGSIELWPEPQAQPAYQAGPNRDIPLDGNLS